MKYPALVILGMVVLATASFAGGFMVAKRDVAAVGALPSDNEPGGPDWVEQDLMGFEFVQDALARWASKNQTTTAKIIADQATQAVMLPDRVCAQFVSRTRRLGGAPPVYCYKLDPNGWPTTQLVYADDDLGE